MTARDDLDRQLVAWLTTDAPTSAPEHLLGEVLARTARTRRRAAWRVPERWNLMSAITSRIAAPPGLSWRVVLLAALLVLTLVGGAVLVAGSRRPTLPPPFGPAGNGAIVYSVGGDLMAADSPAAAPRTLVGGDAFDNGPLMSPDGTRIAFVRGRIGSAAAELWTARADGSAPRRLVAVPSIGWVEWSPRSDAVAVLLDGSPSTIRIVSASDGSVKELDTGLAEVQSVIWRPADGAQLALRGRDGSGTWGIYLVGRDGSGLRRLALDPGFETDAYYTTNAGYYFQGPAWSADGARLLYYTLEPAPDSPAGPGYRNHVALVDAGGTVTADRVLEFDAATDDEFVGTWLSGDSILFQTVEGTEHRLLVGSVAEGHGPARDLGLSANDWFPFIVSPDTRTALVSLPTAGQAQPDIRSIDLATGATTPSTVAADDFTWQRLAAP